MSKNIWIVKHFCVNPRNNTQSELDTKIEAIAEMRKYASEDTGECSILYKNGKQIARRDMCKKNISWD